MAFIDLSALNFCGDQVTAISQLLRDRFLETPNIRDFHTIFENIVVEKEMGYVGKPGMVGKAGMGCNPTSQDWNTGIRTITWEPTAWDIYIEQCWTDLEATMVAYELNYGVRRPDFTETDYMVLVQDLLLEAMQEMWFRFVWFGDTEAQNVSAGGVITNGVDVTYFTVLNGLWKQIIQQTTVNPTQLVTITQNAGTTYEDQTLTPAQALAYTRQVIRQASNALKADPNRFVLMTSSVYQPLIENFQLGNGCCSDLFWRNTTEGINELNLNGTRIIEMPLWDEMIDLYQNTGTRWNQPNRILYSSPDVLGIGVDSLQSFVDVLVDYDRRERNVAIQAMGLMDTKLTNPNLFTVAI